AGGEHPGQWRRDSRGFARPSVRRLRDHQDQRHRARPGAGGQDRRRPWRHRRVRQPAAPHHLPRPAADLRRRSGGRRDRGLTGATILIADDDRAIRTVLSQALGRLGHEVRTASNAATLWQWVESGTGDLVITDVVMPDENGLDLILRIKRLRPDLRVIVMSAQNTLLTAVKATERGAFDYLPKPFDHHEVVRVVQRALGAPKPGVNGAAGESAEGEEPLPLIGRSPA